MKSPNEFWLTLHQLAAAYQAEGQSSEERAESIAEQFDRMPHLARREVLDDLCYLASHLADLRTMIVARANLHEQLARSRRTEKAG